MCCVGCECHGLQVASGRRYMACPGCSAPSYGCASGSGTENLKMANLTGTIPVPSRAVRGCADGSAPSSVRSGSFCLACHSAIASHAYLQHSEQHVNIDKVVMHPGEGTSTYSRAPIHRRDSAEFSDRIKGTWFPVGFPRMCTDKDVEAEAGPPPCCMVLASTAAEA